MHSSHTRKNGVKLKREKEKNDKKINRDKEV